MNYYYLHPYFPTFNTPSLFNDPKAHENVTQLYYEEK